MNLDFCEKSVDITPNYSNIHINNIDVFSPPKIASNLIYFYSSDDYILKEESETIIQAEMHSVINGYALIETCPSLIDQKSVFFCDSLVTVQNGKIKIPIINVNIFPVFIPQGLQVATSINITSSDSYSIKQINAVTAQPITDYQINNSLLLDQQTKITELLDTFKHLFAHSMKDLKQTNLITHSIELIPDSKPVYCHPFRRSAYEEEIIEQQISEMLDAKIIQHSTSPFSSPLMLIKKPNGEWRVVNDFRKLNKITIRDVYLLPRPSTVLQELGGHSFFSQLDLFSGYFQIPLDSKSRHLTAFLTSTNLYEYRSLPQGCMNSASAFSRLMSLAFQPMKKDCITWYLDDIAVLGRTFDHHLENLQKVLKRLDEINLRLKPAKCFFGLTTITFLGFEIDGCGIKPNAKKIAPILKMPVPTNVKEVQSYLGMINFYRKHIYNHSIIAAPLYNLVRKDTPFKWDENCEAAFQHFKTILTSPPILGLYDENLPVTLEADACKIGIGGIISQKKDGKDVVIEFHSRQTNNTEKNYSATELELLGCCYIIAQARCYVFGKRFKLITDHSCLKYLSTLRSPFGKLARWYTYLSEYDFEVVHRPGKHHSNVDTLSRLPLPETIEDNRDTDLDINSIFLLSVDDQVLSKELFIEHQESDEFCNQKLKQLNNSDKGKTSPFLIKDGILMKQVRTFDTIKNLVVVPESLMDRLIKIYHDDSTHSMALNTFLKMRLRFYHPHLFRKINRYCQSCPKCQRRNPITTLTSGTSDLMPTSSIPFEIVSVDLMGDFPRTAEGNKYILVVIDIATRYLVTKAIKDKTMGSVTRALVDEIFFKFGPPSVITTDRGKEFLNSLLASVTKTLGIDHRKTTSYHPNSNSVVERANRNLGAALAKRVNGQHNDWDFYLPAITFGFNTCFHTVTKQIPFCLLYNKPVKLATDNLFPPSNDSFKKQREIIFEIRKRAENRIKMEQLRVQEKRNEKLIDNILNPGDLCLIKRLLTATGHSKKFSDRYYGPFEVVKMLKDGLYQVKSKDGKEKLMNVNRTNLKRYFSRENESHEKESTLKEQRLKEIVKINPITEQVPQENDDDIVNLTIDTNYSVSGYPDQMPIETTRTVEVELQETDMSDTDFDDVQHEEVEDDFNVHDNYTINRSFHSSLPDLSLISGNTDYQDAMSQLSEPEFDTQEQLHSILQQPRRSRRPIKAPERYGFDLGTNQEKKRGSTVNGKEKRKEKKKKINTLIN